MGEKHQKEGSCQTEAINCITCSDNVAQISSQTQQISEYERERKNLMELLSCDADISDLDIVERVEEMMNKASAVKGEVQKLKEERLAMTGSLEKQLAERDTVHSDRVRSLEIVLAEKEKHLLQSSNLRREQLAAATTKTKQLERQIASLERDKRAPAAGSLEQEMDSLRMVLDMKKDETERLKASNNKLELERFHGLEIKLQVQTQKTEEMNAVINMKNEQLRQVLDEYDKVQQQLEVEVSAHLACQQELEKSQWAKEAFLLENEKRWKEISNQKMSGMVLDVVQKEKALAYSFNC